MRGGAKVCLIIFFWNESSENSRGSEAVEKVVWLIVEVTVGTSNRCEALQDHAELWVLQLGLWDFQFCTERNDGQTNQNFCLAIHKLHIVEFQDAIATSMVKPDVHTPHRRLVAVGQEFAKVTDKLLVGREVCRDRVFSKLSTSFLVDKTFEQHSSTFSPES